MEDIYAAVPLSPLRKIIAGRMVEAIRTIPHFRVSADVEMDALLARREEINAGQAKQKVSVNDCLIKACAAGLVAHPEVNCQLVEDSVRRYRHADISVVVAVKGGLSTPVVRRADEKSVRDIAAEAKTLIARAGAGQLKMDEITGGSFSLSNLGPYGVDQFDAIINPPQCAILAVGRARPRLVCSSKRQTRVASVMSATLSVDHRVIDGATAALFLNTLREQVESPDSWLKA